MPVCMSVHMATVSVKYVYLPHGFQNCVNKRNEMFTISFGYIMPPSNTKVISLKDSVFTNFNNLILNFEIL